MKMPGTRLRRMAGRVCSPRTLERLIDPLSLAELRQQTAAARLNRLRSEATRHVEFHYQFRLSLACAPLFFAMLVLALSRRPRSSRLPIGAAVALAYLACFLFASPAGATPPWGAAWLPNFALAAVSALAAAPKALR